MALTSETWPITAALLQFPALLPDGTAVQYAAPEVWAQTFAEVADAGFSFVDLTDSWVRPGDLTPEGLRLFHHVIREAGLDAPVISSVRRSVIDERFGDENLAYSHRTIDAGAELGVAVVSIGLHQALTAEQQQRLWFWTAQGHHDPFDDRDTWDAAVHRIAELGKHAAQLGILLSLEMYEDTFLGTADSAVRLVQEIGLDNVGLNPDVGNLIRLHRPIEDWREVMQKVLPYSNYWHVKNYFRDEDPEQNTFIAMPAPMESGLINYRWALREAISVGFQGIICTEHYGGDGLSVCARNRDYLRRFVLPKSADYQPGVSSVAQQVTRSDRSLESRP
jgi:sugar phosphate isomerase/epimerase